MNGAVNDKFREDNWLKFTLLIFLEFWLTWSAFTMGFGLAKMQLQTSEMPVLQFILSMFSSCNDGSQLESNEYKIFSNNVNTEEVKTDNLKRNVSSKVTLWRESATELAKDIQAIYESDNLTHLIVANSGAEIHHLSSKVPVWVDEEAEPNPTSPPPSPLHNSPKPRSEKASPQTLTIERTNSKVKNSTWLTDFEYWLWFSLFSVSAVVIWSVLLYEESHPSIPDTHNRQLFRSVALAPVGAWLRWGLARFPWIKTIFPDINPQTLIANLSAVTLMCLLLVLAPDSSAIWVVSVNNGRLSLWTCQYDS